MNATHLNTNHVIQEPREISGTLARVQWSNPPRMLSCFRSDYGCYRQRHVQGHGGDQGLQASVAKGQQWGIKAGGFFGLPAIPKLDWLQNEVSTGSGVGWHQGCSDAGSNVTTSPRPNAISDGSGYRAPQSRLAPLCFVGVDNSNPWIINHLGQMPS